MRSVVKEALPYLIILISTAFILWAILLVGTSSLAAPRPATGPAAIKHFSDRTLVLDIELDRNRVRLLNYSLENRPFARSSELAFARPYRQGRPVQVSLILHGPGGMRYTQRVEAGAVCLEHDPGDPSHGTGSTSLTHRGRMAAEVPEIPGFDLIEIVFADATNSRKTTTVKLDKDKFITAGSPYRYDDLMFADRLQQQ